MVGQQHTDGLGGDMTDIFQVDHDSSRQRLIEENLEMRTEQLDRFAIVQIAHLGCNHQDVLDDLRFDFAFRLRVGVCREDFSCQCITLIGPAL